MDNSSIWQQINRRIIKRLKMAKEISGAKVVGRAQNRTALGMMHAFVKMNPHLTLNGLKSQFPKAKVCPDAGIDSLFYSLEEIESLKNNGNKWFVNNNACFMENNEYLHLGNGEKVAFNKIWTENSLDLLQKELSNYNIKGSVNRQHKGNSAGFSITYYQSVSESEDNEEVYNKLSIWFWIVAIIILVTGIYFAYDMFFK